MSFTVIFILLILVISCLRAASIATKQGVPQTAIVCYIIALLICIISLGYITKTGCSKMFIIMPGTHSIKDVSFIDIIDDYYLKVKLPDKGIKTAKILGIQKSNSMEYSAIIDSVKTILNESKLKLIVPEKTDLNIDTLNSYIFYGKYYNIELGSELLKRGLATRDTSDIHFVTQIKNMHIESEIK